MKKMPDKIMPEAFTRQDRDTIIRLDTKFDILIGDVKDLKDNLINRVGSLETTRADKSDLETVKQRLTSTANHADIVALDARIEVLENYRSWVMGGMALIGVVIALVVYIYFSDINTIKNELQHHIEQTK